MSTQTPVDDDRRGRRVIAWVFAALGLLLLLLVLARLLLPPDETGAAGPSVTPSPSASGSAEPTPSPTDTAEPVPSPSPTGEDDGSGGGTSTGSGSTDGDTGAGGRPFTMTATLVGGALRPGAVRTVRIVVSNPNTSDIELQRVDVAIGTPSHAGCLPSWVQVGNFRAGTDPRTVVPGRGTATLSVPIELLNLTTVNQNACKGTSFPLGLSGTATQGAP